MRIALVGPVYPYRGGIAHYTARLCQTLRDQSHEVLAVSFRRQYPRWLFPGRTDRDPSTESLQVPDARYWIDSLNPVSWLQTAQRVRRYRPDVLVMQWWTTFWAPAWFVLAKVIRSSTESSLVFICHNVLPHEARIWDRWVARTVLGQGTHLIVQSAEEDQRLKDLLPDADSTVVSHPVYDLFPESPLSKAEARRALGVPPATPVLLFFGIVREYKGLMDLIEAMPEVRRRCGKVRLVIAGEFWEPKGLYERRLDELGIQDSVTIDDRYIPNEEVPLYFRAADLVVAPHRRATGSGVVQMAIGFGVPLLTTLDWLFDGVELPAEPVVVPPGDVPALASAICAHLLNPCSAQDPDGVRALRDRFSWERLTEAITAHAGAVVVQGNADP